MLIGIRVIGELSWLSLEALADIAAPAGFLLTFQ